MRVSVITVCYNAAATLDRCVASVMAQRGVDIEYIVVDGGSKDATLEVLAPYRDRIATLVSEPDKGIYDAMNKGLALATGDFVGYLNADDFFVAPDALASLFALQASSGADCVFADVEYVDDHGQLARIYRGKGFDPRRMRAGVYPPHPTFYARTALLRDAGGFEPRFKIAGDFDLMLRVFLERGASWAYLDKVVARMQLGGVSTRGLSSYKIAGGEILSALAARGVGADRVAIHLRFLRKGMEIAAARARALAGGGGA